MTVVTAAAVISLQRMSCKGAAAPSQGWGLILQGRPGVYEVLRSSQDLETVPGHLV